MEEDECGREASGRKAARRDGSDGAGLGEVRGEEPAGVAGRDPLAVLGPDVFARILVFSDARSVARSVVVSRGWQRVASSDRLWQPMHIPCGVFWRTFKYLHGERNLIREDHGEKAEAKIFEAADLSENFQFDELWKQKPQMFYAPIFGQYYRFTELSIEELCRQTCVIPSAFFWLLEELWMGKAHIPRSSMVRGATKLAAYSSSIMDSKRARIMKEDLCDHVWEFHFERTAPDYWLNLDPFWNGTGLPMHRYFHPDGSLTADPNDLVWGGHECTYLIVTSFVDGGRIRNHYVRINGWPQISVSRRQDWGWKMANHLYCFSSICDAEKEGGIGPFFPVW